MNALMAAFGTVKQGEGGGGPAQKKLQEGISLVVSKIKISLM